MWKDGSLLRCRLPSFFIGFSHFLRITPVLQPRCAVRSVLRLQHLRELRVTALRRVIRGGFPFGRADARVGAEVQENPAGGGVPHPGGVGTRRNSPEIGRAG